jgi:hypothetical protein
VMVRKGKQAVSDLKPGDRRAGERQRGLCPAAGVAHSLFSTLPPALAPLSDVPIYDQTHTTRGDRRSDRWRVRRLPASGHSHGHPIPLQEKYEMRLIQKQKREIKRPITVKLEQELAERLNSYARFLESSRDHVIGSIVK